MMIESASVHKILGKSILADGYDVVVDLKRSHGSFLYDIKGNREILDFFTFFASSPIGYNHPKLRNDHFLKEASSILINKPSNSDVYTVELAEFVDTFARIAAPPNFQHLFFISGGALAVENALKTAFDWKVRKNIKRGKKGEIGTKVIHFENSFHGRSGYTLSLTNTFDKRKIMYFPKFDWPRFKVPNLWFPITEEEIKRVKKVEEEVILSVKNTIKEYGDDIAAIIIEPIQGEGGDNHFRGEFLKSLADIARENDIMYILDEIQTGFGLTGKMWCYEHFDFEPDIVVFGKKTQVCGIMVGARVDEVENNVFVESSRINSTFGGNLIDMMRCKRYLEIVKEEKLVENAAFVGAHLLKRLEEVSYGFKGFVTDVRGRGLMIAFSLLDTGTRDKVFKEFFDNNLFTLKSGARSIRFRPPLNLSKDEAELGIEIIEKVLKSQTDRG